MVVQKAIDNLKDGPHEDKKAVASGIAITVIVVLLIGWSILFIRRVQNMPVPSLENSAVPADQFNLNAIRNPSARSTDENDSLRNMRNGAASPGAGVDTSYTDTQNTTQGAASFNTESSY